jgi:hypothetical protein
MKKLDEGFIEQIGLYYERRRDRLKRFFVLISRRISARFPARRRRGALDTCTRAHRRA